MIRENGIRMVSVCRRVKKWIQYKDFGVIFVFVHPKGLLKKSFNKVKWFRGALFTVQWRPKFTTRL